MVEIIPENGIIGCEIPSALKEWGDIQESAFSSSVFFCYTSLLQLKLKGSEGGPMKPPMQRKSKIVLLFSAVLVFQCCCCILPYSWSANLESFTLASPFQREEEIHVPARGSLKAEANEEYPAEGYAMLTEKDANIANAAGEEFQTSFMQGTFE
jgi:hypothetical protein